MVAVSSVYFVVASFLLGCVFVLGAYFPGHFTLIEEEKPPARFFDVLVGFFFYMGFPIFVLPLFKPSFLMGSASDRILYISLIQLIHLGLTGIFLLLYLRVFNALFLDYLWKRGSAAYLKDLAVGIAIWPLAFFIMSLWNSMIEHLLYSIFPGYEIQQQLPVIYLEKAKESIPLFFLASGIAAFLAPFVEELLFRGVLQNALKRYFPRQFAIVVTAAIFAAFHYAPSQGLSNISIVSSLFVFALFLGILYEKRRSLLASISLHATFNTMSVLYVIYGEKAL